MEMDWGAADTQDFSRRGKRSPYMRVVELLYIKEDRRRHG